MCLQGSLFIIPWSQTNRQLSPTAGLFWGDLEKKGATEAWGERICN